MKYLSFIIVIMVLCGCAEKNFNIQPTIEITDNVESISDTTYFEKLHEIRLEKNPDCEISYIKKIAQNDSIIYIKDQRQDKLFIFSTSGKHLGTIKDLGKGKNEYINILDFTIDKHSKELLLLVYPYGIMHYSLDGAFKYKDKLDRMFTDICCDKDYYYLRCETFSNKKLSDYLICTINKSDKSKNFIFEISNEYAPFCSLGPRFYDCGDKLLFTNFFDNHIYELSHGTYNVAFNLSPNDFHYPTDDIKGTIDCSELFKVSEKNKYVYGIAHLKVGTHYTMFTTNLFDTYIYDMLKGKCLRLPETLNSSELGTQWQYLPLDGTDNCVCGIFNASVFTSISNIIQEHPKMKSRFKEKLINLAKDFKEEDNPLIIIYKFK